MELTDFDIGRIVISKAGRDKGKIFVVFGKLDAEHVLLVDGFLRRIDKPKKKKIKHLIKMNLVSDDIKSAVLNNEKISNAFIRRELERLGLES